jgi:hypothetical protein
MSASLHVGVVCPTNLEHPAIFPFLNQVLLYLMISRFWEYKEVMSIVLCGILNRLFTTKGHIIFL